MTVPALLVVLVGATFASWAALDSTQPDINPLSLSEAPVHGTAPRPSASTLPRPPATNSAASTVRASEPEMLPDLRPQHMRRPRPASWAAGKMPRPRLSDTGAGVLEPLRSETFSTWQVIGPFHYDSTEGAFAAVHPLEKDWVALGQTYPAGKQQREWWPCEGFLPLGDLAAATGDTVSVVWAGVYYAVCWAKFPSLSRELGWQLDCSCGWKFWINGQLVEHSSKTREGNGQGLQRVVAEGWNEFLVKLVVPLEHEETFKVGFSFEVVRPPGRGGNDDAWLPYSMNEPP